MKKIIPISAICIAMAFYSCNQSAYTENNEEGNTEAQSESATTENSTEINLSDYDLNASISIPDESKGKAEISLTDWGSIEIRVGERFGIEIVPFGMTVEEKRAELEADLVYQTSYLDENENLLFYEKSIKESDIEMEYHFFYTTELDGDIVEIKSLDNKFSKSAVESMIESAKSLKSINPA